MIFECFLKSCTNTYLSMLCRYACVCIWWHIETLKVVCASVGEKLLCVFNTFISIFQISRVSKHCFWPIFLSLWDIRYVTKTKMWRHPSHKMEWKYIINICLYKYLIVVKISSRTTLIEIVCSLIVQSVNVDRGIRGF